MSKKPPSRDEALEALDFIVNVLKDHEKDLDRLINELGTIAGQFGETGEISGNITQIEQRISGLQGEVKSLADSLSAAPHETPLVIKGQQSEAVVGQKNEAPAPPPIPGPPVILRCKQWEDFQSLACQAHTMSFLYKEAEKTFQVDAVKDNQVVTYSGELPKITALLKTWLSKQLDIYEKRILEGILAIG